MELYTGRTNDWVAIKDGGKMHSYLLFQVIHQVNIKNQNVIIQYQIIQNAYHSFQVKIVLDELEYTDQIQHEIVNGFQSLFSEKIDVQVSFEDILLPRKKTGKLSCFQTFIN